MLELADTDLKVRDTVWLYTDSKLVKIQSFYLYVKSIHVIRNLVLVTDKAFKFRDFSIFWGSYDQQERRYKQK